MGERAAIDRVEDPVTVSGLRADLRDLGIGAGDTVLVHASLSAIGWVSGGAQAVIEALQAAVTEDGTLVMPTHTGQYSDPADWEDPPVPEDWQEEIRGSRPPFHPAVTPSRGVGRIPETFRTVPGAIRSTHPLYSFAAWGADAERVAGDHPLDHGLGADSPLGAIYELDGQVLLLGTGHDTNTSLHLAEYLAAVDTPERTRTAPVRRAGERVEVEYRDIELDVSDFEEVGAAFDSTGGCEQGAVGAAQSRLCDQRELVDFAVEYFETHR
ncbi:MAG: aminoglycoside N(3)-acetyltransferase [Halodesulfurarchaeum sp.]